MGLDDPLHEAEAETVAVDLAVLRVRAPIERIEDMRQILRVDASPLVGDRYGDLVAGRLEYGHGKVFAIGRVLQRIRDDEYVILLDERGKLLDSPALSKLLLNPLEASKTVTVIIGGAYGVDASVERRANIIWALSPLVFPHQLVRLILAEQLYRAQEIAQGNPYHHA